MRALPILLLAVTLAACDTPEATQSDAERARIVQEITSLQSSGLDACQTLVLQDCFAHFADDATFITHSRVLPLADFKQVYASHPTRFRSLNWIDRQIDADVIAPEAVIVTMQSRFFFVDTLGVPSDTSLAVVTALWKRIGSTWKTTYVHESFYR